MSTTASPHDWRPCKHGGVLDIGGLESVKSLEKKFVQNLMSGKPFEKSVFYAHSPDWSKASEAQEYYQTHEELAIVKTNAQGIFGKCPTGVKIIDIGAGSLQKAEFILNMLEEAGVRCTYIAIDINRPSLSHNIPTLARKFDSSKVYIIGLHGTLDDGMKKCHQIPEPRLFLSLGSTICNKPPAEAVEDLQGWRSELGPQDALLFGQDAHTIVHREKIEHAYHNPAFQGFIESFRSIANRLAGQDIFTRDKWDLNCSLGTDSASLCHMVRFVAKEDVQFGHTYTKGTTLDCFTSYKHDEQRVHGMCAEAGMQVINSWRGKGKMIVYCIQSEAGPSAS